MVHSAVSEILTMQPPDVEDGAMVLQARQFAAIEQYISHTDSPERLTSAVDVYTAFHGSTSDVQASVGPRPFTKRLIRRATALAYDRHDGTAVPHTVAAFALPAVRKLVADPGLKYSYQDLESHISRGVGSFPFGTADYIAGSRIIHTLHSQPDTRFSDSSLPIASLRGNEPHITESALLYLRAKGVTKDLQLLDRTPALAVVDSIIHSTIQDAAIGGNVVAKKLTQAYRELSISDFKNGSPGNFTVLSTLAIANAITPQLIDQADIKSYTHGSLEKFGRDDLHRLPQAFGRLLFAVDPKLLDTATNSPLDDGTPLRLQMVYLEALSQSWLGYHRARSMTVGDYALRLIAQGKKPADISSLLADHANPVPVRARQTRRNGRY